MLTQNSIHVNCELKTRMKVLYFGSACREQKLRASCGQKGESVVVVHIYNPSTLEGKRITTPGLLGEIFSEETSKEKRDGWKRRGNESFCNPSTSNWSR